METIETILTASEGLWIPTLDLRQIVTLPKDESEQYRYSIEQKMYNHVTGAEKWETIPIIIRPEK